MIIKKAGSPQSTISIFDLLGNDETALSKAFAFVLSKEREALNDFLKFIELDKRVTKKSFREVNIVTEYSRNEGRTDIEIQVGHDIHVIIESKIRKNRVKSQRTQYLTSFNESTINKVLVFLTQERDSNKQIADDVRIINRSWQDIIFIYDQKKYFNNQLVFQFLSYLSKNYNMNEQNEILIQDLSDLQELERYKKYNVYRRDQTFGTPLYFAPYFTRKANQQEGEGISFISRVLGVLTLNPNEISDFEADLRRFKDNRDIVERWVQGVKLNSHEVQQPLTYYFLDQPVKLKKNLLKDGGNKIGRGKNWIAAMIPKNRSVTFEEFVRQMNK